MRHAQCVEGGADLAGAVEQDESSLTVGTLGQVVQRGLGCGLRRQPWARPSTARWASRLRAMASPTPVVEQPPTRLSA